MKWKKNIFTFLTRKRRFFGWFIHLNAFGEKAFSNQNNDHLSNGEYFLQKKMSEFGVKKVFDIGANTGDWSKRIAELIPSASINAFEPIPETYKILESQVKTFPNIIPHAIGLSDKNSTVSFFQFQSNSIFNSQFDRVDLKGKVEVKVKLKRGTDFCVQNNIEQIDFIKIDVEGLEMSVLKGFEDLLITRKIKIIQFEYGSMNIEARTFLKDFYDYLLPFGFILGKLFPNGIEFNQYEYKMDDFKWANYVAVLKTEENLIKMISI